MVHKLRDEFYAFVLCKKIYEAFSDLQQDLDSLMSYYNNERPHSGRYCYGKAPMQTFTESVILAKQKLLNNLSPAA